MRALVFVLVVALALAGGLVYFGPYLTLQQLDAALDSGDAEALDDAVDFPVLRQNLKEQLGARFSREVGEKTDGNPFAVLGAGLATLVLDGVLDAFITPAGIAGMIAGQRPAPGREPGRPTPPSAPPSAPPSPDERGGEGTQDRFREARVVHESLDRASVWIVTEDGDRIRLVLRRSGLDWRLTNIVLPGTEGG